MHFLSSPTEPKMHVFRITTLLALSLGANATPTPYPSNSTNSTYLPPRLITLEEHMLSPSLKDEAIAAGIQNAGPYWYGTSLEGATEPGVNASCAWQHRG